MVRTRQLGKAPNTNTRDAVRARSPTRNLSKEASTRSSGILENQWDGCKLFRV